MEELGRFIGLLLGDGSISEKMVSFVNSSPRYIKEFRSLLSRLFNVPNTKLRFYIQDVPKNEKESHVNFWTKEFPEINNYRIYTKNKLGKSTLLIRLNNVKKAKEIMSLVHKTEKLLENNNFSKGFIDGIIACEGYFDKNPKRVVISQKKKEVIELIKKALETLKINFFTVADKKNKLFFRISRKNDVLKLYELSKVSKDKLEQVLKINWKSKAPNNSTIIKILLMIHKKGCLLRKEFVGVKSANFYFYAKESPLHKKGLVKRIGTKPCLLKITNKGLSLIKKARQ